MSHAEIDLRSGAQFPYDHEGEGPPRAAVDWAEAAARGVLSNLSDRRGIKSELDAVDQDVRVKLVADLAEIIRLARDPDTDGGLAHEAAETARRPHRTLTNLRAE